MAADRPTPESFLREAKAEGRGRLKVFLEDALAQALCGEVSRPLGVDTVFPVGREGQLFDTFTRFEGSDRQGGTGLGLAIVKGFAEAMGVGVSAATVGEPRGAVFTLRLPDRLLVPARSLEQMGLERMGA